MIFDDIRLRCLSFRKTVVQALAKLAMDKAFDFQELRKPGDTDLVAIDRVFEKCRICKEPGHVIPPYTTHSLNPLFSQYGSLL